MRTIFTVFILLFIFICSASAQVSFGVKAGINVSKMHYDDLTVDFKNLTGLQAGVLAQIKFSDKLVLRPELLYSSKGYKLEKSETLPIGLTNRLNYIALPVLAGYSPVKGLQVLAGPELAFLVAAHAKTNNGSENVRDTYKKFDIGIAGGIAYTFFKGLGAEVRYTHGLVKNTEYELKDRSGMVISNYKSGLNRSFQAGLFYLLGK